jgi:tRNA-dihydrouridine synthase
MENEKLQDPVLDPLTKLTPGNPEISGRPDRAESPIFNNNVSAIKALTESQQRTELKVDAIQNAKWAEDHPTFKKYIKKNALPLSIFVVLFTLITIQAVQISHLRKSINTLSGTTNVLAGAVNDSSNSITELKTKLKENKQNQIDLIRKLKSEYASGYNQILAKEKYLNQLNQSSTIQKVEAALEHFWQKLLSGFN